jgi:uncharacterized protein (TIGR02421 family)
VSLPSDPSPVPAADAHGGATPRADDPSADSPPSVPADPTALLPDEIAATLPIVRPEAAAPQYRTDVYELSERLRQLQRPIRILSALQWPPEVQERFFASGAQQQPEVSRDTYAALSYDVRELQRAYDDLISSIRQRLGRFSPIAQLMVERCEEWIATLDMLAARGTTDFAHFAARLYGRTSDAFHAGGPTTADLGLDLSARLEAIESGGQLPPDELTMDAHEAAVWLQERIDRVFDEDHVTVEVSEEIVAQALAGAKRVRFRADARFSERQLRLLEVHEVYVHVATTLNGRRQPVLTFLDKGPPSTTLTQEGLAVLAEVTAFTSHPTRLRRINDRVEAIHKVEDGATFLDVFRWFVDDRGHEPQAAYADAMRVFRGSLPDAGPYPKDLAYNKGFIQVYNFLSVAIAQGKVYRIGLLFTGKTALERVGLLSRAYAEGLLAPPRYLPPHFADLAGLGSWLAYSRFLNQMDLERIEADYAELL